MHGLDDPQGDQVFAVAVAEKQQRARGMADTIPLMGTAVPGRRHGQVVRQRISKSFIPSSNLGAAFQSSSQLSLRAHAGIVA